VRLIPHLLTCLQLSIKLLSKSSFLKALAVYASVMTLVACTSAKKPLCGFPETYKGQNNMRYKKLLLLITLLTLSACNEQTIKPVPSTNQRGEILRPQPIQTHPNQRVNAIKLRKMCYT